MQETTSTNIRYQCALGFRHVLTTIQVDRQLDLLSARVTEEKALVLQRDYQGIIRLTRFLQSLRR